MKVTISGEECYEVGIEDCEKCGSGDFDIEIVSMIVWGEGVTTIDRKCNNCEFIKSYDFESK